MASFKQPTESSAWQTGTATRVSTYVQEQNKKYIARPLCEGYLAKQMSGRLKNFCLAKRLGPSLGVYMRAAHAARAKKLPAQVRR